MADGSKQSIKGTQERVFHLERQVGATAAEARYFASLSSEAPVERWFGTEILSHDSSAVNMERAARGLPLLFNHNMDEPLGKVMDVTAVKGKLRGELVFGGRAKATEIRSEIDSGMLGDISIRYSIDEYTTTTDEHGHDTVTITRWTVLEASVVTVPADPSVGIGRSRHDGGKPTKEKRMDGDENENGGGSPSVVTELRGTRKQDAKRAADKALKEERERVAEMHDIFNQVDERFRGEDFDDLRLKCVTEAITIDGARRLLLEHIQGSMTEQTPSTRRVEDSQNGNSRARPPTRDPMVQAGKDGREKLVEGVTRSIEERVGMLSREAAEQNRTNEFRGLSLVELARTFAVRQGLNVSGMNPYQMLGHVLKSGAQRDIGLGTEDFTGVLANVASKSLLKGWTTANTTYRQWVRIGTLPDFKRANRTAMSGMEILPEVKENGEYTYGKSADRTEYITAIKYGKLFSISREALLNDDLNVFTATPQNMGRAADLTINKAVYDSLCTASGVGPTLNQDSLALFHSTHGNYTATSGTPAVSTLEVGRNAMARQTDPTNSMPLNIQPKYLLVPSALSSTAKILVASEKDPLGLTSATGGATVPNPFYNQLTVITDAYLDDTSHTNGTVAWYLIADQNTTDTYEVGFINGQDQPYLESKNGWDVDGVEYKVRIEAGVAALDYRGMYRKKGA